MGIVMAMAGCGSPPSVLPTLRVVRDAIQAEAVHVERDGERDQVYLDQTLASLDEAFRADLADREALDKVWVQDAVLGYTAAREAVIAHGWRVAQVRSQRLENLEAMAEAQGRAVVLLESQDRLLKRTLGVDLWRLEKMYERKGSQ